MKLWDYKLPKHWQPTTTAEWIWYLERKINYGDFRGLKPVIIKKYWRQLHLDQGKKLLFKSYFDRYGTR